MEFKKQIIIKTASHEEELAAAEKIHKALIDNPDYSESRIMLNMSGDRHDGTENEVHVYIFPDAQTDIEFTVTRKSTIEKSNGLSWAEKEIEIACKREAPDRKDGEWDYGCACYESALKAYKSLMVDGHSGFSIGLTKQILNRLIDGKPLTPIEDTPDIWSETAFGENDSIKHYLCTRMSSLFKDVYPDGTIKYNDVGRVVGVDPLSNTSWYSGLVARIVDKMFPITMPYCPDSRHFRVICEEFLTDKKNGDFDTVGVLYIIKPDDERVEVNRYFKDAENGWDEIDKVEYDARKEKKI